MPKSAKTSNGANLGFEQTLWKAADKMRGAMDPSEYKHVALGLMFLKYISDGFEELHHRLESDPGADPEDRDEYKAENVFWVPPSARWTYLQNNAKQPQIGTLIDDAMLAIEKENPSLKGVLPKDFARPALDKTRLGELIDLLSSVGLGDKANRSRDILGRIYEYFLAQFASAEGKKGGEFYTPRSVVRVLVEMLAPYKGRVYDPCCGTGGMFVQSEEFILAHGGRLDALSVFGQESNPTTWRLAKMNLAIRGIENNLGAEHADSFHRDLHPDLKADYVLANPPFNMSDWGGERLKEDKRWVYGVPPAGNANYAWIQHFIHHLAPGGTARFVMANGSLSSNTSGEGDIRKAIIEGNLLDCIISLPGKLFYTTPIPVCLWFLHRKKPTDINEGENSTLFIDARKLGHIHDRKFIEFSDADISLLAETYHIWKKTDEINQVNKPGFCKSVTVNEIRKQHYSLVPGLYIETKVEEPISEEYQETVLKIVSDLNEIFLRSNIMNQEIKDVIEKLRFEE